MQLKTNCIPDDTSLYLTNSQLFTANNNLSFNFKDRTNLKLTIFSSLTENKSYVPYCGCVLDHILQKDSLPHKDRLFYLLADSLALISSKNNTLHRSTDLAATSWAKILNCSKSEVYLMQKNLEEKGYFTIIREKNKFGKNKRNIIIPTLPDQVFRHLCKEPDRFNLTNNIDQPNALTNKRAYLDQTKLFIKLNYHLLQAIASDQQLSLLAKILWLYFDLISYKKKIKNKPVYNSDDPSSFVICYTELQNSFNCSKATLSKAINQLYTLGFINRQRFHVKNDNEDDNLHDKALWTISLSLPQRYQQLTNNLKNKVQQSSSDSDVSCTDPYVAKNSHLYNKYFILNKDIDKGCDFFTTVDPIPCDKLSELSESYKNISEEICATSTSSPLPSQQFIKEMVQEVVEQNPQEKIEEQQLATIQQENQPLQLTNDLTEVIENNQDDKPEQTEINQDCCIISQQNSTVQMVSEADNQPLSQEMLPKSLSQLANETQSKTQVQVQKEPQNQGRSLQAFYKLSKKQVDRINRLSEREFSCNFANQLLLKLYCRDPNKRFLTENHMISYMSKAFRYEKHQATVVNHDSFRFIANISPSDAILNKQEKYLSEVEYSIDTSYDSQLRKKIASIFEPALAYQILTEVKFVYHPEVELSDDQQLTTGASYTIKLPENLTLTDRQQDTLEKTLMSVYGNIDITYKKISTKSHSIKKELQINGEINFANLDPNSSWYRIRKKLQQELGEFIDKTWFSQLTAKEDTNRNTMTLYAPSNLIRDWVTNRYGHIVGQIAGKFGYRFVELVTKK